MLRAYLLGDLDPAGDAVVDEHLEMCGDCQRALDTLDGEVNAPFAGLRPTPAETGTDDPLLRQLADRAKALGQEQPPLCPGQVLGNYLLLEALGSGGMGRVFKAVHQRMKRQVALKVIAPELVRSAAARERFRREVEAVARLASPYIVAAYDAGEDGGRDFLVMEYIDGCTLADLVKRQGPLPVETALRYTLQAARGLAHAHVAGVFHRDVKPANLLLARDGTVKVLDLGLAHLESAEQETTPGRAAPRAFMGTAQVMAPEQAWDPAAADGRADIYSLGCTLYYLLTGQPPYESKTTLEVLLAHRDGPIPSLRQAQPGCPAEVDALFRRLVAKRPEQRPASMHEVCAECERLLEQQPSPRRRIRRLALAGVLAAIGASVAALLIAAMSGHGPEGSPDPAKARDDQPAVIASPAGRAPVIEMVRIPAGELWMGSPDSDRHAAADERPRQKVKITQPFLLSRKEITQAQYEEVMGTNPSAFSRKGRFKDRVKEKETGQLPVESVSWLDAVCFCNRLSERHGLEPYYKINGERVTVRGGKGYRLPTEAEWEYAARGGTSTTWPFGEKVADLGQYAWFADNAGDVTHPVGGKKANPFGLFDMAGNVPEWCWDRYDPEYYGRQPASDPAGPGYGAIRVFRGGAWNSRAPETRPAGRNALGIAYSVQTIVGIRAARLLLILSSKGTPRDAAPFRESEGESGSPHVPTPERGPVHAPHPPFQASHGRRGPSRRRRRRPRLLRRRHLDPQAARHRPARRCPRRQAVRRHHPGQPHRRGPDPADGPGLRQFRPAAHRAGQRLLALLPPRHGLRRHQGQAPPD
jgi:formylglycine-generating enzyme required for sulfatase activity